MAWLYDAPYTLGHLQYLTDWYACKYCLICFINFSLMLEWLRCCSLAVLSICLCVSVLFCTGLQGSFIMSSDSSRASDYSLDIIQDDGEQPIAIYDHRTSELRLLESGAIVWPDNSTDTPDELPLCYEQTCFHISMYVLLSLLVKVNSQVNGNATAPKLIIHHAHFPANWNSVSVAYCIICGYSSFRNQTTWLHVCIVYLQYVCFW